MSQMDSQEFANDDVEKLFLQKIHPIIPTVVGQACSSLDHYPDQMEFDGLVQRITLLLIDDDYRVLRSFDRRSEPGTWLYTIAWRYILRRLQEQGMIVSLDDAPPDSFIAQPNQEEGLTSQCKEKALFAAVSKLTERERKLFGLLRQGHSVEKIAEEMKIKSRSASVMKNALMKKLEKIIKGECTI